MHWLSTFPLAFACLAVLFVPGGLISLGLGMRGLPAVAIAPAFTVTVVSLTAMALPYLHIRWGTGSVLAVSLLVALVLAGLRLLGRKEGTFRRSALNWKNIWPSLGLTLAFLAAAGIIAWQLVRVIGHPSNISQTFDNVFHLNAIRYILDTGNASSLTITAMTNGDQAPYFYPAAWHGLTALIVQLTNAPIPVVVNLVNICIAAAVWPLGCMLLARVVVGSRPMAVMAAGLISTGFSAFPILLLDFGVLYPNFLSLSLLPVGIAAVAIFFNTVNSLPSSRLIRYATALLVVPGVAVAHPNGFMSLLVLSLPIVVEAFWCRFLRGGGFRADKKLFATATAAFVAGLAVLVVMWIYIRPPAEAATWNRIQTSGQAIGEILTNSPIHRPVAWVISALVIIGLLECMRKRRHFWVVGAFVITGTLFMVVSGFEPGDLRNAITGVWYNDSFRLAALLPLTALPLATLGFVGIADRLNLLVHHLWNPKKQAYAAVSALLIVVIAFTIQGGSMQFAINSAKGVYAETPNAALLSSDELALIDSLDRIVPKDAVIAVQPWTGSALAFALANRQTTSRHTLSTYTKNQEIINTKLRDAGTDPSVCPAVLATGVQFVLDFGTKEVNGGHHDFPGLDDLSSSTAVSLVQQDGQAKLYRVIACR